MMFDLPEDQVDEILVAEAYRRLATVTSETQLIAHEDLMEEFGLTDDDLDDGEETEFE
ncbi:hypothetical protein [Corynebacterium cystitidis]|uniref:hypothetical protein n=1 Tax=Corynebacterium cystitidis TaxID=35757 RepID=UPI00211EA15B|nr:hypothetical protein [Corynebacterium cystitidis]